MHNLAEKPSELETCLEYGQVLAVEGRHCLVRTSIGELTARIAASCLLQPVAGDEVLIVYSGAAQCFVLAVLERTVRTASELAFDGDVMVRANRGGIALQADQDLSLAAERQINCASDSVSVSASTGSIVVDKLAWTGRIWEGQIKRLKLVTQTVDQICHRLTQRLTSYFRFVKEEEEAQCGSQRVLVEETLTLQSKNSTLQSEENVIINAEQIHLG